MANEIRPYIPADKSLPEFTLQALILGLVLSVIMCSANIYVGLYAGMTVSAAIPASVISMGVLRGLLRRGTILENNVVHTIASSGESLAALSRRTENAWSLEQTAVANALSLEDRLERGQPVKIAVEVPYRR